MFGRPQAVKKMTMKLPSAELMEVAIGSHWTSCFRRRRRKNRALARSLRRDWRSNSGQAAHCHACRHALVIAIRQKPCHDTCRGHAGDPDGAESSRAAIVTLRRRDAAD